VKPSDAVLERTQVRVANPAASELGKNSVGGLLISDDVRVACSFCRVVSRIVEMPVGIPDRVLILEPLLLLL
jgi:hypothetical protein